MTANVRSLGWLGTGRMGAALAGPLLQAGEQVTVWNRTPAKTAPLVSAGARAVEPIAGLGTCDIVFVMVSASADLEEVVAALLGGSPRPGMIVDCSTVSAAASARVRAMAAEAGAECLAAPVSGNPHVVAEGAACIVASGPLETFTRARPYLDVMARVAFLEFLNGTVLASDWVRKRTPDLVARDWTPTFTTELLRKDFDLGLEAARSLEVPLPVAAAVHQLIQSAIGTGLRDADFL